MWSKSKSKRRHSSDSNTATLSRQYVEILAFHIVKPFQFRDDFLKIHCEKLHELMNLKVSKNLVKSGSMAFVESFPTR